MPKLVSIKRPFAKKTENVINCEKTFNFKYLKDNAKLAKNAESSCTKLAKVASELKKFIKVLIQKNWLN